MIKHKISKLLDGIDIGYFDTCKPWGEETNDYYYKFFNDEDKEIRSGSILIFTAMLGNWYHGPADVFYVNANKSVYYPPQPFYLFEDYLSSFINYSPLIKKEFPVLYSYTLNFLYQLDQQKAFERVFPHINQNLFIQMRDQLFINDEDAKSYERLPSFNTLLREVGLPTFFLD